LQSKVQTLIKNQARLPKPTIPSQQCVMDFSSPNIAKEMHDGHLRSTIIGEAVCRVLEFVGHTVERVNHVGDWGTQFGMIIEFLKEAFPEFSSSVPNITDLTAFYKLAKERFDVDADFKKTSQLNVVKLQSCAWRQWWRGVD
jgi:arginyl-tRNA synthetase